MNRLRIFFILGCLTTVAFAENTQKPNVILIMTGIDATLQEVLDQFKEARPEPAASGNK